MCLSADLLFDCQHQTNLEAHLVPMAGVGLQILQRRQNEAGQLNLLLVGPAPFRPGLGHVKVFMAVHKECLMLLGLIWELRMFRSRAVHLAFCSNACVIGMEHTVLLLVSLCSQQSGS